MAVVTVNNLTKDYGNHRGCFNVSFEINQGEVFGYLGPNGAGKTVTIRNLLGFVKPDRGIVYVNGKAVWGNSHLTNADIGYIPGEINFPNNNFLGNMTGIEMIKWSADMRGTKSLDKANYLLNLFELNPNFSLKRMSKGMKQKVGIVCAMMHDSKILVLDEPTNGLDPLMQDIFVQLIEKEKSEGKTILMSSHMFNEVEKTCDRIAIIKQGEIVTEVSMNDIKKTKIKTYKIKFAAADESKRFVKEYPDMDFAEVNHDKNRVRIKLKDNDINRFLTLLQNYKLQYLSEIKMTLEDYFMHFYSNKKTEENQNVI